jgi:hypothetical protein
MISKSDLYERLSAALHDRFGHDLDGPDYDSMSNSELYKGVFRTYRALIEGGVSGPIDPEWCREFHLPWLTWEECLTYLERTFFQLGTSIFSHDQELKGVAENIRRQLRAMGVKEPSEAELSGAARPKENRLILLKLETGPTVENAVPEDCEPEPAGEIVADVTADPLVTVCKPDAMPDAAPVVEPLAPRGDVISRMIFDYQDRRRRVDEFDPPD